MSEILAEKLKKYINLTNKEYKAFCEIDRKKFVPKGFEYRAYDISAIPLGEDTTISSPLTIAKMTHYLELDNVDNVLEIGCGSGYQAAILSRLVRRVFTIDRICQLVKRAKKIFKELKLFNINAKCDDGRFGWKTYAPYDRILFSGYIEEIPKEIFNQLKDNGFILAPLKVDNKQIITKIYKNRKKEFLESCEFVPIKKGIEK